jgi:hypothetical protein
MLPIGAAFFLAVPINFIGECIQSLMFVKNNDFYDKTHWYISFDKEFTYAR